MTDSALKERLLSDFDRLPLEQQRRVQEFARSLRGDAPGADACVPASSLVKYAGMLGPEAASEIREAIEEAFERVDGRGAARLLDIRGGVRHDVGDPGSRRP